MEYNENQVPIITTATVTRKGRTTGTPTTRSGRKRPRPSGDTAAAAAAAAAATTETETTKTAAAATTTTTTTTTDTSHNHDNVNIMNDRDFMGFMMVPNPIMLMNHSINNTHPNNMKTDNASTGNNNNTNNNANNSNSHYRHHPLHGYFNNSNHYQYQYPYRQPFLPPQNYHQQPNTITAVAARAMMGPLAIPNPIPTTNFHQGQSVLRSAKKSPPKKRPDKQKNSHRQTIQNSAANNNDNHSKDGTTNTKLTNNLPNGITTDAPTITKNNKPTAAKSSINNNNNRSLPPSLACLYQQLDTTQQQLSDQVVEQHEAEQLLAHAQRRLQAARSQTVRLQQTQQDLEERILQGELSLDNNFTRHYRQLEAFRQKFGHANVNNTNTNNSVNNNNDLAAWAKKIRRIKASHDKSSGEESSNNRPPWNFYWKALDRIGFVWDAVKDQWQSKFDKMLAFKAITGHCCVPKSYQADKALGAWVHRQRYHYKLYHEGKPTQLTLERIELLNSVGFSWSGDCTTPVDASALPRPTKPRGRQGTPKRTAQEEWEYNFQQLVQFKQQHGHVKISSGVDDKHRNNQLRDWVAWQRREYKRWKEGQPDSHITEEQVQRLSEIGFPWEIVGRSNHNSKNQNNATTNNIKSTNREDDSKNAADTTTGTGATTQQQPRKTNMYGPFRQPLLLERSPHSCSVIS